MNGDAILKGPAQAGPDVGKHGSSPLGEGGSPGPGGRLPRLRTMSPTIRPSGSGTFEIAEAGCGPPPPPGFLLDCIEIPFSRF
jgi:hypothetical protein